MTAAVMAALALGLSVTAAGQGGARVPDPSDTLVHPAFASCAADGPAEPAARTGLRVGTWNMRAARSAPVEAIAAEIGAMAVDVIALQEVDVRTRRSGSVDQAAALAAALGMHYAFAAAIKWEDGDYGLAVLSRWPFTGVQRHRLDPTLATEPRIVLEASVCAGGRTLRLFNHHSDGWAPAREAGFAEIRAIVQPHLGGGLLVMGDFNELADGVAIGGLFESGLVDLGAGLGPRIENRRRIDYLLADPALDRLASRARVWPTDKSDHHAMLVDLAWFGNAARP